jgi:hypothetical protein
VVAGPLGLHHVERRGGRAELGQHIGIEVQRRARQRDVIAVLLEMVVDANDLERRQVDQRMQALDGVGVVIVERKGAHPDETVEDATPLLDLEAEIAHRPGVDADILQFGEQAAPGERCLEARVFLHGLLDQQHFLDRHHGARVRAERLVDHLACGKIDTAHVNAGSAMAIGVEARDAMHGRAGHMRAHHVLGGLLDIDGLDPQVGTPAVMLVQDSDGGRDFGSGQRVERVARRRTGVRSR